MELNPRDSAIQVVRLIKDKFKFSGTVVWSRSDIHNGTRISEILLQESTLKIIAESPGQTWKILAPNVQPTPRYTSNDARDHADQINGSIGINPANQGGTQYDYDKNTARGASFQVNGTISLEALNSIRKTSTKYRSAE
jgi:hypothetical protein